MFSEKVVLVQIMKEEITFKNQNVVLKGTLIKPDINDPCPVVVVAHTSNAGTRDFVVYQHLANTLTSIGIAVFLYDRRGSGESTGNFNSASFFDLADDALAAINHLKLRSDINPEHMGVWGMSQGGWIAPLAASSSSDISFVVAVSSVGMTPANQMNYSAEFDLRENGFPEEEIKKMLELRNLVDKYYHGKVDRFTVQKKLDTFRKETWFPLAYLDVSLPEDPTVEKWYQEMDFDPLTIIRKIDVPVLLIYAERDPWVPIAESIAKWKEYGPKDLSIHQVKNANHFMISIAHSGIRGDDGPLVEEYSDVLIHWLMRQLA